MGRRNKANILNMRYLSLFIALLGTLILPAPTLSAGAVQSHDSIRDAARRYIEQATGYSMPPTVTVNRLDNRLRLQACNKPLEAFSPPGRRKLGRVTVGVRCNGNKPWSLYVPVTVALFSNVVVVTRDLPRGAILTSGDLKLVKQDIARLNRGFMEQPTQAIGKTLKRSLQRGQVLTPRQITAPQTIKKGSRVAIIASNSAMRVSMRGKALSGGATGERIRVQNLSSKRELEATIISPGVVKVSM